MWMDLALAAIPFLLGMRVTWRVVWPRWKRIGKPLFYAGMVMMLSAVIGHWSVLVAILHQGLGLAGHVWFCRRHGFTWYAVEDPDRYIALSKQRVGVDGPSSPRT